MQAYGPCIEMKNEKTEAEKPLNLHQKLLEVKKQVQYLQKTSIADVKKYTYNYVGGSQLLHKVNEGLNKYGVILKTEVLSQETIQVESDFLYKVEMLMTWINVENPADREACAWFGSGFNGKEKGYGSALTYAERYFMLKFFNIPTDELDPDSFDSLFQGNNGKTEKKAPKIADLEKKYDQMILSVKNENIFTDKEYAARIRKASWTDVQIAAAYKSVYNEIGSRKSLIIDETS